MKVVKQTADYTIYEKKSGRYGVMGADKKWVNGDDKVKVLLGEKLITLPEAKAAPPEESADAPAETEG